MHIIKISPTGFKIILSKSDLEASGISAFENPDITSDFLVQIIEQTNRLYGNPFTSGSIDAEFFESKDGGGELFISKSTSRVSSSYLFCADSIDDIVSLCKRLKESSLPDNGSLYLDGNKYMLIMEFSPPGSITYALLSEYGKVQRLDLLKKWHIDEHCKKLIKDDAINILNSHF